MSDLDEIRRPATTVRDAIADLDSACDRGSRPDGYDIWGYGRRPSPSAYAKGLRDAKGTSTSHRTVPHKPEIVKRFAKVLPGEFDEVGLHPRLLGTASAQLRAGTGAERDLFKPFGRCTGAGPRDHGAERPGYRAPDSFRFHPTTWHSFRMIGNSVSPAMAEALLGLVAAKAGIGRELQAAE